MKTRVLHFALMIGAILCFSLSNSTAQTIVVNDISISESEEIQAGIHFDEEIFDFGEIAKGEVVTHVFTFTNNGIEPLVIVNVKGSCGCTVPQWPREPIAPGETASLTVKFNSKGRDGMQTKRVTITANTEPQISFLTIRGEVIPVDIDADGQEPTNDTQEPALSPDCFAIYPNPTAEILKLDMEESALGKMASISIFSDSGQLMAKREIDAIAGTIEFNVSHYPQGTYIAHVQVDHGASEARCFVVVN
jgi:hypothetical protein